LGHAAWEHRVVTQAPVLVGIDLSPSAAEAIRQAGAWARRSGAPLVAVHVAPDELFRALETPKVADALRTRIESTLGPECPAFDVVLAAGSAHGALVQLADARKAALVVVGASEASSGFFGSTAEQVVRYAHCPVLVTRTSPKDGVVLAATDFSEQATSAVKEGAREAMRRGVPLRLVHSIQQPMTPLSLLGPLVISMPDMPVAERDALKSAAETTLRTLLESTGAPGACEVLTGPPTTSIPAEARRVEAGLVVVATHGRTGLARVALGSVAEAIARHAPCSVLAVRKGAGHPE
jgi:nucleotide-binding universal stress UspA family protein